MQHLVSRTGQLFVRSAQTTVVCEYCKACSPSAKTSHNFEQLHNIGCSHVYRLLKRFLYECGFSAKLTGYLNYVNIRSP